MDRRAKTTSSFATFVCALVLAPVARATPPPELSPEESKDLHALQQKAKTLFEEGDYRASADLERRLFEKVGKPDFLYNVGQALRLAGDEPGALAAYREYLKVESEHDRREEAAKAIALLEGGGDTDKLPPRIDHLPVERARRGQPITIIASIDDPSGVGTASLSYRVPGSDYASQALIHSHDKWNGAIPPIDGSAVEYFIEAWDSVGNGPARSGTPTFPHRVELVDRPPEANRPPLPEPVLTPAPKLTLAVRPVPPAKPVLTVVGEHRAAVAFGGASLLAVGAGVLWFSTANTNYEGNTGLVIRNTTLGLGGVAIGLAALGTYFLLTQEH